MAVTSGLPVTGHAGGIDHKISQNESGIWNPNVYRTMMGVLSVADLGGALWEGSVSRLGKTEWQTIDSQLIAGGSAQDRKKSPHVVGHPLGVQVKPGNVPD